MAAHMTRLGAVAACRQCHSHAPARTFRWRKMLDTGVHATLEDHGRECDLRQPDADGTHCLLGGGALLTAHLCRDNAAAHAGCGFALLNHRLMKGVLHPAPPAARDGWSPQQMRSLVETATAARPPSRPAARRLPPAADHSSGHDARRGPSGTTSPGTRRGRRCWSSTRCGTSCSRASRLGSCTS
jgi:hypothetical protein